MKKSILLVVAIATISLVACTSGATDATSDVDTTVAPVETIETEVVETAVVDTTAVDSAAVVAH